MNKVAVVVLNFNGVDYIGKCLESLRKLNTDGLKVSFLVVDNASSDKSIDYIKQNFSEFDLIQTGENLGYAEGNNVGIRQGLDLGVEWIWIVNPDIEVHPDSLKSLITFSSSHTRAGILGSKVYFSPGFEFHKAKYKKSDIGKVIWYAGGRVDWDNIQSDHRGINEVDSGKYDKASRVDFITGASMLLKSEMLNEVGLLDRKYFLYFEENDLGQRAMKSGWELWYVPQSIVWHANAQATGVGSALVDYYTTRNRLLFGLRWAPLRSKLALVRESLRLLYNGRRWQKRGILDFYLGRYAKGSYA